MIVELAFDGRLDFSKLDLYSAAHGLLLQLFHNVAVRRTTVDETRLLHQRTLQQLSWLSAGHPSRKSYEQQELKLLCSLLDVPEVSQEERDRRVASEARKTWEAANGDMSDPEVRAAIDRTVNALLQR